MKTVKLFAIVVFVPVLTLIGGWFVYQITVTRKVVLRINSKWNAQVVGLGLRDDQSLLGLRYLSFDIDDSPYSRIVVINQNQTYNPMVIYYPNGKVMVQGSCKIKIDGENTYPLIDEIDNVICYKIDGQIGAQVVDGTGTMMTYHPTGEPHWVSTYENYERTSIEKREVSR